MIVLFRLQLVMQRGDRLQQPGDVGGDDDDTLNTAAIYSLLLIVAFIVELHTTA